MLRQRLPDARAGQPVRLRNQTVAAVGGGLDRIALAAQLSHGLVHRRARNAERLAHLLARDRRSGRAQQR